MATLAGIFDLSTERLTSFELPGKKAIVLLRWTLFVSLLGLGATSSQGILSTFLVHLILGIFLAVNLLLSILPADTFRATHLEFSLGLIDTALISYVVYESDHTGYLCLFFFVLLISTAASTRIGQILLGALSLSTLYLLVSSIRDGPSVLLSIPHLMVIPLFYATALYFGYQVLQIRGRHAKVNHLDRERQELRIVLNTLESVTSSLDFHHVMFQITSRIADAVDAVRCSILLIEEGDSDRAHVVATSDDLKIKMLPLDLCKYPEVQTAIRDRKAVIIEDVEKSEMLRPYLRDLLRLHFHSLLILPMLYRESVIGTLMLRATRKRSFTQDELKLCRILTSAAAGAIKNSMLYRSVQDRVREQEETAARLRSLLDNSPDLIMHLDAGGSIREVNRAVEQVSGRARAEMLSLNLSSLIQGLPPLPVLTEKALESKMPLVYDAKLLAAENRERDLSVTVGATRESKGELILIGRDVTEQKQVTAMLQQTEKLSSIGEIVAGVAHELNNPLMGVLGYSQLLARKDTKGQFKRDIERILESSNHCRKIVQNLLSFARPSKPDQKQLGLNGVLEKTLDLLEHSLRGDNIEVVKNLAPNLPYVLADFHQIQQVFTNLINNARQAMSTATGKGRLLLRSYVRDASVVVEVTDNGPGIPPEILPRIFDPFFSTKEQGRGTGLGLSISYGIVRDHGGDLLVDSHLGERTTFSVVFPVAKIPESETVPDKPAVAAKSVLVVDDEAVLVDLYLELLRALGHAADTASTGREALKKIEARNYDLVITDIKMPKMNGIQLYEKVLTIRPAMRHRFIFITGSVDAVTSQQLPILRDIPCLLKPLSINKIEAAICEVLGRPESSADAPVSPN